MGKNPKCSIPQPKNFTVAKNGVKLEIRWNPGFSQQASGALQRVQTMFDHEFVKMTDKYVPMDTGTLKNSAIIATDFGSGDIVYNTPYANRQYAAAQYYMHELGTVYEGVRGPHWGERSIADNKVHFETFVDNAMKSEMDQI